MKKISLPIRFGLVTTAVLIAYFLILAMFHKHTNPFFSFLNAPITAFGIFEVVRFTKLQNRESFTYGEGFKTGLITGFIATLFFTIFFLIYSTEIDTDFVPELLTIMHGGLNADVGTITFVVAIMGLATTMVSTLAVMQIFKKSGNVGQSE